jgi:hypothetical protein
VIKQMPADNPLRGAPRIHGEMLSNSRFQLRRLSDTVIRKYKGVDSNTRKPRHQDGIAAHTASEFADTL